MKFRKSYIGEIIVNWKRSEDKLRIVDRMLKLRLRSPLSLGYKS